MHILHTVQYAPICSFPWFGFSASTGLLWALGQPLGLHSPFPSSFPNDALSALLLLRGQPGWVWLCHREEINRMLTGSKPSVQAGCLCV